MLEVFSQSGNLTLACSKSGMSRATHYHRMLTDTKYAERFQEADDAATDALVAEARRRGLEGWDEPVGFFRGQPSAYVRRHSDNLLMFMIK